MDKKHYDWWGYVKSLVQKYPGSRSSELSGVALRNHEAVKKAVDDTMKMDDGADHLKVISMVHWERTRTLEGAGASIPCNMRTAARWQRGFFEAVAINRDLMDGPERPNAKWIAVDGTYSDCPICKNRTCRGYIYNFCPWCGAKLG